jgi:hypothetical protein
MSLITTTTLLGLKKTTSPIIGALAKNWQAIAAVLLVAVVVYQNTFEHRVFFWADTIPYLRNLTAEQLVAIKQIEAANEQLRDDIEMRNDQIDEWKAVSIDLERNVEQLNKTITTQQTITRNQVRAILSQPTPQTCEASINFLRDHIPDLQYGARESEQ